MLSFGDASTRRSVFSPPPQQKEAERIEQKGLLEVACEVAVKQYLVIYIYITPGLIIILKIF